MRLLLRLFSPLGIALCLLLGCGKPAPVPYPPTMVEAARLSEHEAARALPLLEALADSLDRLDEEGRVYYDLLRLRVNDKLNVRATSDTLIRRITAFYEAYGDPDKLMLAYYYRGRVCADLNDALQAVEYYRKAIAASKETKQYLLLSNIYSQLGEALEYQNLYEEAIPCYRKAYDYTLLSRDSVTLSMPFRDMAAVFQQMGQPDSALYYYEEARVIASKTNHRIFLGIMEEMSELYMEMGEYDKALAYLRYSLNDPYERDHTPTYYLLGKLYLLTGRLDSAYYYTKKSNTKEIFYKEIDVYRNLAKIEELRGHYPEALAYWREYQKCNDSIQVADNSEEILRMKSLYDYRLHEQEKQRLELENKDQRELLYSLILVAVVVVFLFVIYLISSENKKRQLELQIEKWEHAKKSIYERSDDYIAENQKEILRIESTLKKSKPGEETGLMLLQKERLEATNKQITLRQDEKRILEEKLKCSAIYMLFHSDQSPKSDEEWATLIKELDRVYDLTYQLRNLYPRITPYEIKVCCLVKIGIRVSDIAEILSHSKAAITLTRSRLYAKITGEKENAEGMDRIIIGL